MIPSTAPRRNRLLVNRLLASGCVMAVAAVLGTLTSGSRASANGFAGTGSVSFSDSVDAGDVQISSGADTVTLFNGVSVAVIDWTPSDTSGSGSINFLPNGNAVQFNGTAGDFTVLNNIRPVDSNGNLVSSQVIQLNGTITSTHGGSPGGNVWFYTPGGFLVGNTGVFNVGGLVLSSSVIPDASVGASTIQFTGTPNTASSIQIASGAQINALANNSYVAMVAPSIVQGGTVNVKGQAAYVAAEAADITMNAGLFDITVTTGTDDNNGVVHTGTTAGPAALNSNANQRIYMVAVPKNAGLIMLLNGNMGYTAAATAQDDGGSGIILSAGYDVANGAVTTPNASIGPSGTASLIVGSGTFSSRVDATADLDITIQPFGILRFENKASFTGGNSAAVLVGQDSELIARTNPNTSFSDPVDLTLKTRNLFSGGVGLTVDGVTSAATGTNAGSIDVSGTVFLDGSEDGDLSVVTGQYPANGLNAVGNQLSGIFASGDGSISADIIHVDLTARGGTGTVIGGNATGGAFTLTTSEAAQITARQTIINSSAYASTNTNAIPVTGGSATGGSITLSSSGGSLNLGDVVVNADAFGGTSINGAAGNATGGTVTVDLTGGVHSWTSFTTNTDTVGGESDGTGTSGASTPGGGIQFTVAGLDAQTNAPTSLTIDGFASLSGRALSTAGGASVGALRGSDIALSVVDGAIAHFNGGLDIDTSAISSSVQSGTLPSSTSDAQGGNISITAAGGGLTALSISAGSIATAENATATAGNGQGGDITVVATSQNGFRGALSFGECANGVCSSSTLSSFGVGGSGAVGASGTGGNITLSALDADLTQVGDLTLNAQGQAGYSTSITGGLGGLGQGGSVRVETVAGTSNDAHLTLGTVVGAVNGTAFIDDEGLRINLGDGGTGTGGTFAFHVPVGTFNASAITVTSNGYGGASGSSSTSFFAGNGVGGNTSFLVEGGVANVGDLTMTANGYGGEASGGFNSSFASTFGGDGTGGDVRLEVRSGSLTAADIVMNAAGTGTSTQTSFDTNAVDGGAGFGGHAWVRGVGGTLTADSVSVNVNGIGGKGGNVAFFSPSSVGSFAAGAGGEGVGGTADLIPQSATFNVASIELVADGLAGAGGENATGGDGGTGGAGTGGSANFVVDNFGGQDMGDIALSSTGVGGAGGAARRGIFDPVSGTTTYIYGPGAGGAGGEGTGGTSSLTIVADPVLASLTILANGVGGNGGAGASGGAGGTGFGGTGGSGALLNLTNGALTITGATEIGADGTGGFGGDGYTDRGGTGGTGRGGEATVNVDGDGTSLTLTTATIHADGFGQDGGIGGIQAGDGITGADGGSAIGGNASLSVTNFGLLTLGSLTELSADATGGAGQIGVQRSASGAVGGAGGQAIGGGAQIFVEGSDVTAFAPSGSVLIQHAEATGGRGATGFGNALGGVGGDASGGSVGATIISSNFSVGAWNASASAFGGRGGGDDGGNGERGGHAFGGAVDFVFDFSAISGNSLLAVANATGGAGGNGQSGRGGDGGRAQGGDISVTFDGDNLTPSIDLIEISADATGAAGGLSLGNGADGANGGDATSGTATLTVGGVGAALFANAGVTVTTRALAGNGSGANLGSGTAGTGGAGGAAFGASSNLTGAGAQINVENNANLTTGGILIDAYSVGGAGGSGVGSGSGGAGGNATGGLAGFRVDNASADVNTLMDFDANATGGAGGASNGGPAGTGGSGQGGTADIFSDNGVLTVNYGVIASANGTGGAGGSSTSDIGGAGATGTGGNVSLSVFGANGALSFGSATGDGSTFTAAGRGGNAGASGRPGASGTAGGSANGGVVTASLSSDSVSQFYGPTLLSADALGGNGGIGVAGAMGGTGGDGGLATAGTARLTLDHARLETPYGNVLTVSASAEGGTGGVGGNSTDPIGGNGGSGGNGVGGTAEFTSDTGDYFLNQMVISAVGRAGIGGDGGEGPGTPGDPGNPSAVPPIPPTPPSGPLFGQPGFLGSGTGGTASFTNTDDGTIALDAVRQVNYLQMDAGGTFALNSYQQNAGTATLTDSATATGGALDMTNGFLYMSVSGFDTGSGTTGIHINSAAAPLAVYDAQLYTDSKIALAFDGSGGLAVSNSLYAYGYSGIDITHSNELSTPVDRITGKDVQLYSAGDITADAGSNIHVTGNLLAYTFGNVSLHDAQADGTIGLHGFTITGNDFSAGEDLTLDADDSITLANGIAGDDLEFTASGAITLDSGRTLGTGTDGREVLFGFAFTTLSGFGAGDGSNISLTSDGDITVTGLLATEGNNSGEDSDIELTARGAVTVANVNAFSDFEVDNTAGSFTANGAIRAGEDIELRLFGDVTTDALLAGDDVRIDTDFGDISVTTARARGTGPDDESGGADVRIRSDGGNIALDSADATDEIDFATNSGSITASSLRALGTQPDTDGSNVVLSGYRGIDVGTIVSANHTELYAPIGNINVDNLQSTGLINGVAQNITLSSPDDMSFGGLVADDGDNVISITSGGRAQFTGSVIGSSIEVSSQDIDITSTGSIGDLEFTSFIGLTSTTDGRSSYFGGEGGHDAYELDIAEIGRLSASDISFTGAATDATNIPSVIAGSFTVRGGVNLDNGGTLEVAGPDGIAITGDMRFTGANTNGTLQIQGGTYVKLDPTSGSISIDDGNGGLAGEAIIDANRIIMATQSAQTDIAALNDLTAISNRLGNSDGVQRDTPLVAARDITFRAVNDLFVQNMGSSSEFDSRLGFAASLNTVRITSVPITRIAINGILTAGGSSAPVTGLSVIPSVLFVSSQSGASGFAAGSTINGCAIANVASCTTVIVEPEPPQTPDTPDRILTPVDPTLPGELLPTTIITLTSSDEIGFPPLIDEPVTGAGNEDLWEQGCNASNGKNCN